MYQPSAPARHQKRRMGFSRGRDVCKIARRVFVHIAVPHRPATTTDFSHFVALRVVCVKKSPLRYGFRDHTLVKLLITALER